MFSILIKKSVSKRKRKYYEFVEKKINEVFEYSYLRDKGKVNLLLKLSVKNNL